MCVRARFVLHYVVSFQISEVRCTARNQACSLPPLGRNAFPKPAIFAQSPVRLPWLHQLLPRWPRPDGGLLSSLRGLGRLGQDRTKAPVRRLQPLTLLPKGLPLRSQAVPLPRHGRDPGAQIPALGAGTRTVGGQPGHLGRQAVPFLGQAVAVLGDAVRHQRQHVPLQLQAVIVGAQPRPLQQHLPALLLHPLALRVGPGLRRRARCAAAGRTRRPAHVGRALQTVPLLQRAAPYCRRLVPA